MVYYTTPGKNTTTILVCGKGGKAVKRHVDLTAIHKKNPKITQKPITLNCVPLNSHRRYRDVMQLIIYPDGKCKVGVDAWRELDKHDCCSHPVQEFQSLSDVEKKYEILRNDS